MLLRLRRIIMLKRISNFFLGRRQVRVDVILASKGRRYPWFPPQYLGFSERI